MKKNLLSTFVFGLITLFCANTYAQEWADVIKEVKGDTAVVYGFIGSGNVLNTLWIAVKGDTTATGERTNPNRVYETIPGDVYLTDGTLELDASVPNLVITAPPIDWSGGTMPPLHIKQTQVDGSFDKTFFQVNGNIKVENQYILLALTNETLDREVQRNLIDSTRTEYKSCIFEFTNWVLCFPSALHQTFKFTDCLFLNVGNEPTIEKGIVFDSWVASDTLWMENCTVLNAGGVAIGRTPDKAGPGFAYFNHNTFVNTTLHPFTFFTQAEMVVTNNLMVNSGMLADYPNFYPFHTDEDFLPKGIINIDTMEADWIANRWPDGYPVAEGDRKMLVDNNNAWWDPRLEDMVANDLPAFPDTINEEWASQYITMNSRTQAMFDDDANYPYLDEGMWYNDDPGFTNNMDLIDEWMSFIISNSHPGAPGGGDGMPWWRTNTTTNLVTPDWPPLADLSYSNAELKSGATNNYPVGDLHWYPSMKSMWKMTGESDVLIAALKAGTLPEDWAALSIEPKKAGEALASQLSVYPNPFTDVANVNYEITRASQVDLVIYDVIGQKVRVMDLGYRDVGNHTVKIDRGELGPGMYIIQLRTDYNRAGITAKVSIK